MCWSARVSKSTTAGHSAGGQLISLAANAFAVSRSGSTSLVASGSACALGLGATFRALFFAGAACFAGFAAALFLGAACCLGAPPRAFFLAVIGSVSLHRWPGIHGPGEHRV
jgi:hypothetical protein